MDNYGNWQNQPMGANGNGPVYQQPVKETYGFGVASLVIGILSMTLCCIGGSILGLVGLILGIVSCAKKEAKRGLAIGGIVTSAIGFIIGVVYLVFVIYTFMQSGAVDDIAGLTQDGEVLIVGEEENVFAGNSYKGEEGSVLSFGQSDFIWYRDDADRTDNFYTGSYDVYFGSDAVDHIVNDLPEYGVTEEEMDAYFERNEDSDFYSEDNFCCIVLHNEELIMDGESQIDEPYDTPYMGFYEDGCLDAANMRTGNYVYFSIME